MYTWIYTQVECIVYQEVEDIVGVFGRIDTRWMLIKFEGYDDLEYEGEHLLTRDDCHATIRSFWAKSGKRTVAGQRIL